MTSRIPRPVNSMNLVTRSQRTSRATSIASDDDDEVYKTIAAGSARNISLGEQVHIPGGKTGVLRYRGMTQFKQGEWAGIELDYCSGLNDGSVNEVRYFSCPPGYGIFVPIHKVKRLNPSGNINRYTNSRPCSTTPSISSRSSLKSKSITNSPTSLSAAINSIGHHPNRKTRRYTGEKYQTEALSPKSLSIGDSVNGYSPSVISDQNVSMINILMLERDKAIGTIEKLKQRVEDLEFELEEEKARRTAEELKSTLNAAVQANIQDSTVNELQLQLKNLSVQHNTLLSSVQSYDLSIEVLTNLCDQMDIKHQITMPNKSLSKICDAIAEQFEHKKIALQKAEDNNSDLRCEIEELQMIQKQSEYDFNLQMCKLEDRLQAEIIDLKDNVIANLKSDLEHKTKLVEDQENKLMELEDKLKVNLNANLKFAYDVELSSLENGKEHDITDSTKCDFNKTNCPYQADSNDPSNVAQVESDINNSQLNGQKGGGDLSSNYLSVEVSGNRFPYSSTQRTSDILGSKFSVNGIYQRKDGVSDSLYTNGLNFNNGMHHRNGSEVSGTGSSATASYTPSYFNSSRYSSVLTKTERPPNLGSSRWYSNFNNSISNSTLPNASSSNSSRSTYPTTSAISTTSPFSSTVSTNRTVLNSFRNRYS